MLEFGTFSQDVREIQISLCLDVNLHDEILLKS